MHSRFFLARVGQQKQPKKGHDDTIRYDEWWQLGPSYFSASSTAGQLFFLSNTLNLDAQSANESSFFSRQLINLWLWNQWSKNRKVNFWQFNLGTYLVQTKDLVQTRANLLKKVSKNSEKNHECASQLTPSIYKILWSNSSYFKSYKKRQIFWQQ